MIARFSDYYFKCFNILVLLYFATKDDNLISALKKKRLLTFYAFKCPTIINTVTLAVILKML